MARRGGGTSATPGAPSGPAAPDVTTEALDWRIVPDRPAPAPTPVAPTSPERPPAPPPAAETQPPPSEPTSILDEVPEVGLAPPLAERGVGDDTLSIDDIPPPARGPLSFDEEREGVRAVMEASLHAELLETQGRSWADIEALTGMRRGDQGFAISNPEAIASAAGRGPYRDSLLLDLDPRAPSGEDIGANDPGTLLRTWRGTSPAGVSVTTPVMAEGGRRASAYAAPRPPTPVPSLPETLRDIKRRLGMQIGPTSGSLRNDAVGPEEDRLPIGLAALTQQPARYTKAFADHLPAARTALEVEFKRMLPLDVGVRLVNRIQAHGFAADEVVESPSAFDHRWTLTVALAPGRAKAKVKAFHGIAAHVLRGYGQGGLYTEREWKLLLERAEQEGIREELRREPIRRADGATISVLGAYIDAYARYGPAKQKEFLDQEFVGRLAEHWAAGRTYGARVDTLLARLVKFLEAIRNALRGLGFQTADDVFDRAYSGEIARRAEGGKREPTFGPSGGPR